MENKKQYRYEDPNEKPNGYNFEGYIFEKFSLNPPIKETLLKVNYDGNKLSTSYETMSSDGDRKNTDIVFDGHFAKKLKEANIKADDLKSSNIRTSGISGIIEFANKQWSFGNDVIKCDANYVKGNFITTEKLKSMKLPFEERLYDFIMNNFFTKFLYNNFNPIKKRIDSYLYKKMKDRLGELRPLEETHFNFSKEYQSRTRKEWEANPKEWREAYINFQRKNGNLTTICDIEDIDRKYPTEVLENGVLPEGFKYPCTEAGVTIPGFGYVKGVGPFDYNLNNDPKVGTDIHGDPTCK